ncbi:MAG: DUF739 family protein [Bacilli bacterium]|nr:DUF739 family protein [Bacilli bacterium]
MYEYDYSKLLGRIKEKSDSNAVFSTKLGISERTLSCKLNNKVDFKQNEITKSCEILEIPDEEIGIYFFTLKTQRN